MKHDARMTPLRVFHAFTCHVSFHRGSRHNCIAVSETLTPTLSIPAVPRPVTRQARRRAWAEAGVQVWWKSALVVLLVCAYVAYIHIEEATTQRRLFQKGVVVDARAVKVLGVTAKDNARYGSQRDQTIPVEFETILPDGRLVTLEGYLPPGPGWIKVNQEMKLRVDPDDLTNWAEVSDILPWWRVLAVPLFLMLPIALILLAIAWWRRRRVLKVWEQGIAGEAVAVEVRHSAISPLSRVVRFTLAEGEDKRVFTTLFSNRSGIPARGDSFAVVYPYDQPGRAIAVQNYIEPAG